MAKIKEQDIAKLRRDLRKASDRNLSMDAVERILDKTGIEITDTIQQKAKRIFIESGFIGEFRMWRNGYTADEKPSDTALYIKKALSSCQKLYLALSGEQADDNLFSDFNFLYKTSKEKFGEGYVLETRQLLEQLKNLEFIFQEMAQHNEQNIGKNSPNNQDSVLNWLLETVYGFFHEIYDRKPTINSRPNEGTDLDTPFLRFASQTLAEIDSLGFDINKKSQSYEAIRSRIKRNQSVS